MKIISGKLKGHKFKTKENSSYRPITGRIKEALFSILSSGQFLDSETNKSVLEGATIIDVFGGAGAITFEAFSRGVTKGVIIEKDSDSFASLQKNTQALGLVGSLEVIRGDATNLPPARYGCSIAFIDPPFKEGLVERSVGSLVKKKWLTEDAILVVRTHYTEDFDIGKFAAEVFSRKYNNSLLKIFRLRTV
jgi:16S rRNA (guanine966-N2)-methyltransferase